jgi:hypothetical protein
MKIMEQRLLKIFDEGTYRTIRTKANDDSKKYGILTIKHIKDNSNKSVGVKITCSGQDNHEDTFTYHFTDNGITSSHTSALINASHNSIVTKVTSNTITKKGTGFSHSNNSQVEFKKIIKKDTKTGNITNKLYLKDENETYKLYSTTLVTYLK